MTVHADANREALDRALLEIWEKSRPEILLRVRLIAAAATAQRAGWLDHSTRRAAECAAHKLAGVVGSFGYWPASDLAREAEQSLEGNADLQPASVARLDEIATELGRQLSTAPIAAALE